MLPAASFSSDLLAWPVDPVFPTPSVVAGAEGLATSLPIGDSLGFSTDPVAVARVSSAPWSMDSAHPA